MLLDWNVSQAGVTAFLRASVAKGDILEEAHSILSEQNYNLSNPQKELLLWHYRLGHVGLHWLQDLMRKEKGPVGSQSEGPFIPTKHATTKSCNHPHCAACLMAKQHRTGLGSKHVSNKADMVIHCDATKPGSHISTDQWVS